MADHEPLQDPLTPVTGSATRAVIAPGYTFGTVTDKIASIVLARKTPLGWYLGFLTAAFFAGLLLV